MKRNSGSSSEPRPQRYSDCSSSGLRERLPSLECFRNQFPGYSITVVIPEFTSICPKTGQADFGTITVEYEPGRLVLELKSLKGYVQAYRNLGIFYENAVNRILRDVVAACKPVWARVKGEFRPRGGMYSIVEARFPRPGKGSREGI